MLGFAGDKITNFIDSPLRRGTTRTSR